MAPLAEGGGGMSLWNAIAAFRKALIDGDRAMTRQSELSSPPTFTDDDVYEIQFEFEMRLENEFDLPDAIRGAAAYRYKHLMRTWYHQLLVRHRYNERFAVMLRTDWISYIDAIQENARHCFLSIEASAEEKRKSSSKREFVYKQRLRMLEDAFAVAIGVAAVEELHKVRTSPVNTFDRSGDNMAPIGFHYYPASIRPYVEVLTPDDR